MVSRWCHDGVMLVVLLLQILDWEQLVAQVQGKGHGVIPVHTLSPSQTTTAETQEEENGMLVPLQPRNKNVLTTFLHVQSR